MFSISKSSYLIGVEEMPIFCDIIMYFIDEGLITVNISNITCRDLMLWFCWYLVGNDSINRENCL